MQTKADDVRKMFDEIAPSYDLLNRVLSLGLDVYWRRRLVNSLVPASGTNILDVATGTGDVLLQLATLKPASTTGVDPSASMLACAGRKLRQSGCAATLVIGNAERLPFEKNSFDAVTVAFGVRNFTELDAGLRELHRVLRAGGRLRILEFSKPRAIIWRSLYAAYFRGLLPLIGRLVSGHPSAYRYLPETVSNFPDGETFCSLLEQTGFDSPRWTPITGGIVTLYEARSTPAFT